MSPCENPLPVCSILLILAIPLVIFISSLALFCISTSYKPSVNPPVFVVGSIVNPVLYTLSIVFLSVLLSKASKVFNNISKSLVELSFVNLSMIKPNTAKPPLITPPALTSVANEVTIPVFVFKN